MEGNIRLTIFTPTFNRGYCLGKVYASLKQQKNKQFQWVLMDDGSSDNTEELAKAWEKDADFRLIYLKQENQGRFAAFNNAENYFEGELTIIVDSDDVLLPGAVDKILSKWDEVKHGDYCGLVAHYENASGDILGTEFPRKLEFEKLSVLYDKYRVKGDKVLVFRTDILTLFKYPIYEGERFGGDAIVFNLCCDIAPLYIFPEKLIHLESQADSITNNLLRYHLNSPNGMREKYNDDLRLEKYNKVSILKHAVGYIAFSYLTGKSWRYVWRTANNRMACLLMSIPGFIYYERLKIMRRYMEL